MARVLVARELGDNSGHAVRLARLAAALAAQGHAMALAVQRPDSLRRWDAGGGARRRNARAR